MLGDFNTDSSAGHVVHVQTGRFLLKLSVAVAMQQPGVEVPASATYLKSTAASSVAVGQQGWIKKVFAALAQHLVRCAVSDIMKHPDSGAWLHCVVSRLSLPPIHTGAETSGCFALDGLASDAVFLHPSC
jgi:hypothetical protein